MDTSRWYLFPRMQADEVLLFSQYDRAVDLPGDTWHCALPEVVTTLEGEEAESRPRRSFDVRAFVVFEDTVPSHLDRFSGGAVPKVSRVGAGSTEGENLP